MESNEAEGVTNIAIRSASTLFVLKMPKWGAIVEHLQQHVEIVV
jgi:hypothetical protein